MIPGVTGLSYPPRDTDEEFIGHHRVTVLLTKAGCTCTVPFSGCAQEAVQRGAQRPERRRALRWQLIIRCSLESPWSRPGVALEVAWAGFTICMSDFLLDQAAAFSLYSLKDLRWDLKCGFVELGASEP